MLHAENYVHRDIKPSNLLVDPSNSNLVYFSDFGLARNINSKDNGFEGTPAFASMPAYSNRRYTFKDDFESLCWTFYYLETGKMWKNPVHRPAMSSFMDSSFILRFLHKLWATVVFAKPVLSQYGKFTGVFAVDA